MTDRELKLVKALYECNLDTRLAAKRTRFSHQKFCSYMEKVKRKKTFRAFCEIRGKAARRYMEEFEQEYPEIAREYFDGEESKASDD